MAKDEVDGAAAGQGLDVFGRRWELKGELLQEDVERYTRAFNEIVPRPLGYAEQRSAEVKAATAAGWIQSPACEVVEVVNPETGARTRRYVFDGVEVGKMRAREVYHYARLIARRYVEETEPPDPNELSSP